MVVKLFPGAAAARPRPWVTRPFIGLVCALAGSRGSRALLRSARALMQARARALSTARLLLFLFAAGDPPRQPSKHLTARGRGRRKPRLGGQGRGSPGGGGWE